MPNFTFDARSHTYRLDGVVIPSVTQILSAEGFITGTEHIGHYYLERGTAAHKATELDDLGILDIESLRQEGMLDLTGYVESWRKYKARYGQSYAPGEVEVRGYDPVYQYATTMDRVDCEIKTGEPAKWHKYQISAEWNVARLMKLQTAPTRNVYINEDGSEPRVIEYTYRELKQNLDTFLCILHTLRAR